MDDFIFAYNELNQHSSVLDDSGTDRVRLLSAVDRHQYSCDQTGGQLHQRTTSFFLLKKIQNICFSKHGHESTFYLTIFNKNGTVE